MIKMLNKNHWFLLVLLLSICKNEGKSILEMCSTEAEKEFEFLIEENARCKLQLKEGGIQEFNCKVTPDTILQGDSQAHWLEATPKYIAVKEGKDFEFKLYYRGDEILLKEGRTYEFYGYIILGWPTIYHLRISDDEGLLYFAISTPDDDPHFRDIIEYLHTKNIKVEKVSSKCEFKSQSCFKERNVYVSFSCGESNLTLYQTQRNDIKCGKSKYRVHLAVAKDIEYIPYACADGGVTNFSFYITRIDQK